MGKFIERRRSARKPFADMPWIFSLSVQEAPKSELPMRLDAVNMSRHGLKFQSNQKIPLFTPIQIQLFEKKTKREPIRIQAKVVRVEEVDTGRAEKIFGIAIQFETMTDADRATIGLAFPPL